MRSFPVYLFDVDGTLLDSAEDICGSILEVLASRACPALTERDRRRFASIHLLDLFEELLPDYTPEQYAGMIDEYRRIYMGRKHLQTRVFPGVQEGLAALGGRKSTATTKMTSTARVVLDQFGLAGYFDHVQGTDDFPHKPAPDVVHVALAALGAGPGDCLLVGDSPADMEAGRRAGVQVCAVRYGYGEAEHLARWKPDYWISDLRELLV